MKKIKGFLLLGVATGLIMPMTCINLHYVDEKYGSTGGYFYHTAKNIDIWANVEFRATWNARLITKESRAKFGIQGETISSVLGKNQIDGTLTKEGLKLVKILEKFEKGHCIKWIDISFGEWDYPENRLKTNNHEILNYDPADAFTGILQHFQEQTEREKQNTF